MTDDRPPSKPSATLQRARAEARARGSETIEAEHVLLAIASQRGSAGHALLQAAGLDHEAIGAALDREFEESLSVAGVTLQAFDVPAPRLRPDQVPRWGTSAKLAIHRAPKARPGHHMDAAHLLAGVLKARVGTVPRALAHAGVDREALERATMRALGGHLRGRQR